jgi:hypothetical protein
VLTADLIKIIDWLYQITPSNATQTKEGRSSFAPAFYSDIEN